ncbi:MAG: ribosomal protein L25 Ctc-form [Fusobacteria bacterium]|nr:MAG: ribosomal protein L25 Ctc-form [Fusobacteriota bacterium]KAF0228565.1 MAG: ribosomal protein L25 [Fusobacteriota bacterium]
MEKIIIKALERPKKTGKFKEQGFVPGVLYGEGMEGSASVKFDAAVIRNLISQHGSNAKIWVDYNGTKKFGFVKATQSDMLSNKLLHIDIQVIAKDQKMKIQIPIRFIGEEVLKAKDLELHISKHEVTVIGDMNKMPESIEVDVSELELGGQVTYEDFKLDESLVTDEKELAYGVINHLKLMKVEEPETETEVVAEESVKPE